MIFHKQGGKMRRNANDADRKSGKLYGWLLYYSMYWRSPLHRRIADAHLTQISSTLFTVIYAMLYWFTGIQSVIRIFLSDTQTDCFLLAFQLYIILIFQKPLMSENLGICSIVGKEGIILYP